MMEGIGSRIKYARLRRSMTQEDLAKAVGVTKGAIGNYETGVSSPKEAVLIKLMNVLGIDANYLYQDYVDFSDKTVDSVPENAREVFVQNLTRLMRERGIDQSAIASSLGLTASTVSDWVNGKKYPRIDNIQRLADFFDVPMSALTIQQSPDRDRIHEISESLQNNPKLGLLFDRSRKMSDKDLDAILGVVAAILDARDDL